MKKINNPLTNIWKYKYAIGTILAISTAIISIPIYYSVKNTQEANQISEQIEKNLRIDQFTLLASVDNIKKIDGISDIASLDDNVKAKKDIASKIKAYFLKNNIKDIKVQFLNDFQINYEIGFIYYKVKLSSLANYVEDLELEILYEGFNKQGIANSNKIKSLDQKTLDQWDELAGKKTEKPSLISKVYLEKKIQAKINKLGYGWKAVVQKLTPIDKIGRLEYLLHITRKINQTTETLELSNIVDGFVSNIQNDLDSLTAKDVVFLDNTSEDELLSRASVLASEAVKINKYQNLNNAIINKKIENEPIQIVFISATANDIDGEIDYRFKFKWGQLLSGVRTFKLTSFMKNVKWIEKVQKILDSDNIKVSLKETIGNLLPSVALKEDKFKDLKNLVRTPSTNELLKIDVIQIKKPIPNDKAGQISYQYKLKYHSVESHVKTFVIDQMQKEVDYKRLKQELDNLNKTHLQYKDDLGFSVKDFVLTIPSVLEDRMPQNIADLLDIINVGKDSSYRIFNTQKPIFDDSKGTITYYYKFKKNNIESDEKTYVIDSTLNILQHQKLLQTIWNTELKMTDVKETLINDNDLPSFLYNQDDKYKTLKNILKRDTIEIDIKGKKHILKIIVDPNDKVIVNDESGTISYKYFFKIDGQKDFLKNYERTFVFKNFITKTKQNKLDMKILEVILKNPDYQKILFETLKTEAKNFDFKLYSWSKVNYDKINALKNKTITKKISTWDGIKIIIQEFQTQNGSINFKPKLIKRNVEINSNDFLEIIGFKKTIFYGDISTLDVRNKKFKDVDLSKVTSWPLDLSGIDWTGAIFGQNNGGNPFKGNISSFKIFNSVLNGIDVSGVKEKDYWPKDLSGINWTNVIFGQNDEGNPFKEDISSFKIFNSILNGIDVSKVFPNSWHDNLTGINWTNIKNLSQYVTPFKNNMQTKRIENSNLNGVNVNNISIWPSDLSGIKWNGVNCGRTSTGWLNLGSTYRRLIDGSPFDVDLSTTRIQSINQGILKGINMSQVSIWPSDLSKINWEGVNFGPNNNGSPFKDDVLKYKDITNSIFKGIDVSKVKTWPSDLSGIDWTGAIFGQNGEGNPFVGDCSSYVLKNAIFNGLDLSKVTAWPSDLSGIDWTGVVLKNSIENYPIANRNLKGVDVANVTKWPQDLSGVNWDGILGLKPDNTPFQKDLRKTAIYQSVFNGLDISKVTHWPTDLRGINWSGVKGIDQKTTPFKDHIDQYNVSKSNFKGMLFYNIKTWFKDDQSKQIIWEDVTLEGDLFAIKFQNINDGKLKNVSLKNIVIITKDRTGQPGTAMIKDWKGAKLFGDLSKIDLVQINRRVFKDIDFSGVTAWPSDLSSINWTGIKGLTKKNTPFKGNLRAKNNFSIAASVLNGVDVSLVTHWPFKIEAINWEGVIGLTKNGYSPFQKDMKNFLIHGIVDSDGKIIKTILKGVDVTAVTAWPTKLNDIEWNNVLLKGDLSKAIFKSTYREIIFQDIIKWPLKTTIFNWKGTKIQGDFLNVDLKWIHNGIFAGIDVTKMVTWPTDLSNINWKGVIGLNSNNSPFQGDMSSYNLDHSFLDGIDLSKVTKWPLYNNINWKNTIYDLKINAGKKPQLWSNNTWFNVIKKFGADVTKINLQKFNNGFLEGIDVSEVTKWPNNLSGLNWKGAKFGSNGEGNPFVGNISRLNIIRSFLSGVDVSKVTKWPLDLTNINWNDVKTSSLLAKPNNWSHAIWYKVKKSLAGDLSRINLYAKEFNYGKLIGINISKVTKWPIDSLNIDWDGAILEGDISHLDLTKINNGQLEKINISKVTIWPSNLDHIKWDGAILGGDISHWDLNIINKGSLKGINISKITSWPTNLNGISWKGAILEGDISQLNLQEINGGSLKDIDVSNVNVWPNNLSGIKWDGVIIKGDIEWWENDLHKNLKKINNGNLKNINISLITKWPKDLNYIKWDGAILEGDISNLDLKYINYQTLKGINISKVTKWPPNLNQIIWTGAILEGDISQLDLTKINGGSLEGIDLSKITVWPQNLSGIKFEKSILSGDLSNFDFNKLNNGILKGIDVSRVKAWPTKLTKINWTGVIGLDQSSPFNNNISGLEIGDSYLNGVDVSRVTQWPKNLMGINWKGVKGLTQANTPFKSNMKDHILIGSHFEDVDVSLVIEWPSINIGITFKNIKLDWKPEVKNIKPTNWDQTIYNKIKNALKITV